MNSSSNTFLIQRWSPPTGGARYPAQTCEEEEEEETLGPKPTVWPPPPPRAVDFIIIFVFRVTRLKHAHTHTHTHTYSCISWSGAVSGWHTAVSSSASNQCICSLQPKWTSDLSWRRNSCHIETWHLKREVVLKVRGATDRMVLRTTDRCSHQSAVDSFRSHVSVINECNKKTLMTFGSIIEFIVGVLKMRPNLLDHKYTELEVAESHDLQSTVVTWERTGWSILSWSSSVTRDHYRLKYPGNQ